MIRFDIDRDGIQRIARELGASERQVGMAISRALNRTAATMRRRAQAALAKGLDVRRANVLRKRLRDLKLKRKGKAAEEVAVWFGLNDLRISDLKGRPRRTAGGAEFRGAGYPGGFVAKSRSGKQSIFRRKSDGRLPLVEQTAPIADRAEIILEDEVLADLPDVFMKFFASDLRARTVFGVGKKYE